jgi:ribosomal protein S1
MTENLTTQEYESLFVNDSFKSRKKTKSNEELFNLIENLSIHMPEVGQVVTAKYIGYFSDNYVFSIPGLKDDIRVDGKPHEAKYLVNTQVGDMIDVLITNINHGQFFIRGSISALYESMARQNLKTINEGEPVSAFVKSMNPAGYDINIIHGGVTLSAFMPNTLAGINKLFNPESIVGQTLSVMIESFSENEGTYIVSRRKYLQTLIPEAMNQLQYGEVYKGYVTGTRDFGIFVEFNECLTGMIHKANVHPDWTDRITEVKPGFEIEFYVKEVIKDKIILTQIIRETLWDTIRNGQVIEGIVKDTKGFGTLVSLDEETVGLIHTSEMEKIKRKFETGSHIKVKVLSVDRTTRKIFLTSI